MSPDRNHIIASRRSADRSGFTLIEVLVAFTVMATLMSVTYRSVVMTRGGAKTFDNRMREELIARSLFDEFVAVRDLHNGNYSGERTGHDWTLNARPLDLSAQLPPPSPRAIAKGGEDGRRSWVPQRLVLRVVTSGRPLELETVHLVRPEPPR